MTLPAFDSTSEKNNHPAITVDYFDGINNFAHVAQLSSHADGIIVRYSGQQRIYHHDDVHLIGAVGQVLPAIELPKDARIELRSSDIPPWLHDAHSRLSTRVFAIENSWRWIFISLMMMLLVIGVTYQWGIPFAAEQVARHLPGTTLKTVGDEAEQLIINQTSPTRLSTTRQQHIRNLYQQQLSKPLALSKPVAIDSLDAHIIFRQGGDTIGANALAIPNGHIIITDELVNLTKNDAEILGVLAHEQGHLVERHSLQQALRGLGLSVLYVSLTGDAFSVASVLPLAIVSAHYSQQFELQADRYAVRMMRAKQLPPSALSDFLQRLSEQNHEDSNASDFLDSHPATAKRIAAIRAASRATG